MIIKNFKKAKINLNNYKRVFIIGVGKGSSLAILSLSKILASLGNRFVGGISLDNKFPISNFQFLNKSQFSKSKIKFFIGTHPLPSKKNLQATKEIIKLASGLNEKDLLITFICGGGSALLCGSEKELKASQVIFKELTKKGADIIELNTVRKHISEVKGGGLAKIAYPATVISLIVSDVLGNDISMVASGPTVYDKTTKKDAERILKRYFNMGTSDVPNIKRNNFRTSDVQKIDVRETPKNRKYFKSVKNILFVSNKDAVLAMAGKAKKLGLKPKI
ncbi:glycerate-2-kinase family protein, partial [Candidatus Wolfebacteria bacterium]|nr:glycerate-2-kinase family protein [Candidatus Wolfebacteria bacterium]